MTQPRTNSSTYILLEQRLGRHIRVGVEGTRPGVCMRCKTSGFKTSSQRVVGLSTAALNHQPIRRDTQWDIGAGYSCVLKRVRGRLAQRRETRLYEQQQQRVAHEGVAGGSNNIEQRMPTGNVWRIHASATSAIPTRIACVAINVTARIAFQIT